MGIANPTWVNSVARIPLPIDFVTTGARGSPICVDTRNGNPYILINNIVTALVASSQINVRGFGATGNGTTDDTLAIQAAYDKANALGGGTVWWPEGLYKITAPIRVYPKTVTRGAGRFASVVTCSYAGAGTLAAGLRSGSAFYSLFTINSSTRADIHFHDIGIINSNGANIGAGYYDQGGTFITFHSVYIQGFKYGTVNDQSELVDYYDLDCESQLTGANWLVNGADLVVGANTQFTNRIGFHGCQTNQGVGVYGLIDDGGTAHTVENPNYNGCLNHARFANVDGLKLSGGEWESAAAACITFNALSLAGAGVGLCSAVWLGGGAELIPTLGQHCVTANALGNIVIDGVNFGNTAVTKFNGTVNCNAIYSINAFNSGGGATFDGFATNHFEVGYDGTNFDIRTNLPYQFNGIKVLGAQGAAVADAVHSAAAPTKAEFDAFVDQFNLLLARVRAATGHGLIA